MKIKIISLVIAGSLISLFLVVIYAEANANEIDLSKVRDFITESNGEVSLRTLVSVFGSNYELYYEALGWRMYQTPGEAQNVRDMLENVLDNDSNSNDIRYVIKDSIDRIDIWIECLNKGYDDLAGRIEYLEGKEDPRIIELLYTYLAEEGKSYPSTMDLIIGFYELFKDCAENINLFLRLNAQQDSIAVTSHRWDLNQLFEDLGELTFRDFYDGIREGNIVSFAQEYGADHPLIKSLLIKDLFASDPHSIDRDIINIIQDSDDSSFIVPLALALRVALHTISGDTEIAEQFDIVNVKGADFVMSFFPLLSEDSEQDSTIADLQNTLCHLLSQAISRGDELALAFFDGQMFDELKISTDDNIYNTIDFLSRVSLDFLPNTVFALKQRMLHDRILPIRIYALYTLAMHGELNASDIRNFQENLQAAIEAFKYAYGDPYVWPEGADFASKIMARYDEALVGFLKEAEQQFKDFIDANVDINEENDILEDIYDVLESFTENLGIIFDGDKEVVMRLVEFVVEGEDGEETIRYPLGKISLPPKVDVYLENINRLADAAFAVSILNSSDVEFLGRIAQRQEAYDLGDRNEHYRLEMLAIGQLYILAQYEDNIEAREKLKHLAKVYNDQFAQDCYDNLPALPEADEAKPRVPFIIELIEYIVFGVPGIASPVPDEEGSNTYYINRANEGRLKMLELLGFEGETSIKEDISPIPIVPAIVFSESGIYN